MTTSGPVRTLAVWCAHWPAVALGRPGDVPVAVVHANRIVAVNRLAHGQGVVPGLRRREAQARCPSVELHERDEPREARAFEAVLGAIEELAPRIEVVEPGRCAIATRGPSRYHGGDRALAERVHECVRAALAAHVGDGRVPCPVGVGIADGPRAAAIAAEEAVARAAGTGRPAPPLVVPVGGTAEFLSLLPVDRLRPGRGASGAGSDASSDELIEVLRRLGLRTVGRFAALPAPDVLARFGAPGMDLLRLATGSEVEPPAATDPQAELRVSAVVDPPAERVDRAAFIAKSLADTLHGELAGRGLACTRVLVAAETDAGDRIERLWRHEGALSAAGIAQRVRWQLDGWLSTGRSLGRCSGGVNLIELVPDQVVPDDGVQLGFWGGTSEAGERAVRALARVQALVGTDAVLVPEWRGGRAPAEQYRLVPLDSVDLSARAVPGDEPWPGRVPDPAPAVIWPTPKAVEVVDAEGRRVAVGGRGIISAAPSRCLLDGSDARSGRWHEIRAWAGPWCIDERWWDALAHRRRARLQVVLGPAVTGAPEDEVSTGRSTGSARSRGAHPSSGVAHLLTLEDGRWWLEATYD